METGGPELKVQVSRSGPCEMAGRPTGRPPTLDAAMSKDYL